MKKELWNQDWKFWKTTNTFALMWDAPQDAPMVTLPHDALVLEEAKPDSINGTNTGFVDGGIYNYEKTFFVPEDWKDQTIRVHFDGVYMDANIYLNSSNIGSHTYGYTPFDITPDQYLRYGQENTIRVIANATAASSRWYSGGGIYRDVYLMTGSKVYAVPSATRIDTVSLTEDAAYIEVNSVIANDTPLKKDVVVALEILDAKDQCVKSLSLPVIAFGQDTVEIKKLIRLDEVELWSDKAPNLYRLQLTVKDTEGVICDTEETTFGVRMITYDAAHGVMINGESVKLRGACLHHDSGVLGAATYLGAQLRQVKLLKEAGFNAIRMAHNPAAPALMQACDMLGMYVMNEGFDMWNRSKSTHDYSLYFDKCWEEDVASMVISSLNHPSVIMYCTGNEIPELFNDKGIKILSDICRKIKKMDPSRPTTVAINGVFSLGEHLLPVIQDVIRNTPEDKRPDCDFESANVNLFMTMMDQFMPEIVTHPIMTDLIAKVASVVDIIGYNYMAARYDMDAKEHPEWVLVGSETAPPTIGREWPMITGSTHVIGDFTWTGWDYLGEAGIGVCAYNWGEGGFGTMYPCRTSYVGDIDITGFRRPVSYFREIVYGLRKEPYIAVFNPEKYGKFRICSNWTMGDQINNWTWPGFEGSKIEVQVYSADEKVELRLNGQVIDTQATGPDNNYMATFHMEYQPGTLTAVAYSDGKAVAEYTLQTAVDAELVTSVEAVEGGLYYVTIEYRDAAGVLDMSKYDHLKIEVSEGTLLGFCSGNPKSTDLLVSDETDLFQGRALAVIAGDQAPVYKVCR